MDIFHSFMQYLISLPAIIVGLTFHEYAHGRMAYYLGDDTAYRMGRLTLNPLPHLDMVGFLMLLFFRFGWAKPVPVNPNGFTSIGRKKGMLLVAIAGPAMNFVLAAAGMLLLRILDTLHLISPNGALLQLLFPLITVNLGLMVFNLIPIPPLDGSRVLAGLLPDSASAVMDALERYGAILLLIFVLSDAANVILLPGVSAVYMFLYHLIF